MLLGCLLLLMPIRHRKWLQRFHMQKLNVFYQWCLRKLLHITYLDHIANEAVLKRAGSTRLQDIVAERRFRLAGHILRFPSHRHSNVALQWSPVGETRQKRSSEEDMEKNIKEDLRRVYIGLSWNEAKTLASDISSWRKAAAHCALMHGCN